MGLLACYPRSVGIEGNCETNSQILSLRYSTGLRAWLQLTSALLPRIVRSKHIYLNEPGM